MTKIKLDEILCQSNRDEGDLGSLIEAIKATGEKLLQPILLKSSTGPKLYEVCDGRRRFQALFLMGRKELAPDEYTFVDDAVNTDIAAYIANTERKALSPREEALQICSMLKTMTEEEVAEKLGKTLHYVVSRSRLAELSGKWQQVLEESDQHPNWTIGKLQMIAREPAETQKALEHLIDRKENFTLSEVWQKICYYHRQLDQAPFNWQNFCRVCTKRSDRQGVLFAEDETAATCLDSECFEKHCFNAFLQKKKENPALQPVRGDNCYGTTAGEWADKNKVPRSWEIQYQLTDDAQQANGIICCGENTGRLVKITKNSSTPAAQTSADQAAAAADERRRKAEIKKQRDILRIALRMFNDQISVINKFDMFPPDMQDKVWGLLYHLGTPGANFWQFKSENIKVPDDNESWQDRLLARFIRSLTSHISGMMTHPQLDPEWPVGKELCKVLDWDWEELFLAPARREYEKSGGKRK